MIFVDFGAIKSESAILGISEAFLACCYAVESYLIATIAIEKEQIRPKNSKDKR